MKPKTSQILLAVSLIVNVVLVAILARDWLEHRREALGNVSTADALKSSVSARLLPRVEFEVLLANEQPSAGTTAHSLPATGETFYAFGSPVLTNGDIDSAAAVRGRLGDPALRLIFTVEGARKLREATQKNPRKRLLFVANGKVLMAPLILGPIDATETVVTGRFTEDEVKHIALSLART